MPQYEIQLKDLIRILRRRKNIIIFSMVVLGILRVVFAKIQSPNLLYRAVAKVSYDQTRSLAGITSPVYYFSPYDNINSQTKIITTFPVLEMAADIANAVAESYRDYNREQINTRTLDTKEFIEKQLSLITGRLKQAEEN